MDTKEILSPSTPGGVPREEASQSDPADMSLDDGHDSDGADDDAEVSREARSARGPVWGPMFGQVCFFVIL